MRFAEMGTYFTKALELAPEAERAALRRQATDTINMVSAALYTQAQERLKEFATVESVWGEYLNQCAELLDASDLALVYSPGDITSLENIVHICRNNIRGLATPGGTRSVKEEYEVALRGRMERAEAALRKVEPSHQLSPPVKSHAEEASETMGRVLAVIVGIALLLIAALFFFAGDHDRAERRAQEGLAHARATEVAQANEKRVAAEEWARTHPDPYARHPYGGSNEDGRGVESGKASARGS